MAYVMTRVGEKTWNTIAANLKQYVREGIIDANILSNTNYRPTHILDIYKMRRGRYKNVRIWIKLDLGNGQRQDLFMTTADNQPISSTFDIFTSSVEHPIEDWRDEIC